MQTVSSAGALANQTRPNPLWDHEIGEDDFWRLLSWELLITGAGFARAGYFLLGGFLFLIRLGTWLLAIMAIRPEMPLSLSIAGAVCFFAGTWISPLILSRILRKRVHEETDSRSSWQYIFRSILWTGAGNRGYTRIVLCGLQLILSLTIHGIGVLMRIPLMHIALANSVLTIAVIHAGLWSQHRHIAFPDTVHPLSLYLALLVIGGAPSGTIMALTRMYLMDYNLVPNSTMKPTLAEDSIILASMQTHEPKRGDVLLLDTSKHATHRFRIQDLYFYQLNIQRVLAVSGDHIRVEADGRLFVNNQPVMIGQSGEPFRWPIDAYFAKSDTVRIISSGEIEEIATRGPPWHYDVPEGRFFCSGDKYAFSGTRIPDNMLQRNQVVGLVVRSIWPNHIVQ